MVYKSNRDIILQLLCILAYIQLKQCFKHHRRANIYISSALGQEKAGIFSIYSDDDEFNGNVGESITDGIFLYDVSSGWGNGKHPTTKLCLNFINSNVKKGCSFLDYGTGSGILSILAAKLGASRVLAVDVDYECIRAAKENFKHNNVEDIIDIVHTREIYVGDDRFMKSDITVANILPVFINIYILPVFINIYIFSRRPGYFMSRKLNRSIR